MKFAFPDSLYEKDVEPRIKELVHNALDAYEQGTRFAALREADVGTPSLVRKDVQRSSGQAVLTPFPLETSTPPLKLGASPLNYSDNMASDSPENTQPEIDSPSQNDANAWVEETIRTLKFNQDECRIDDVDDGSVETCDWILKKAEFQRWNAPGSDSVLFVQGGPRLGKSVLAKYLVKRLRNFYEDKDTGPSLATAK